MLFGLNCPFYGESCEPNIINKRLFWDLHFMRIWYPDTSTINFIFSSLWRKNRFKTKELGLADHQRANSISIIAVYSNLLKSRQNYVGYLIFWIKEIHYKSGLYLGSFCWSQTNNEGSILNYTASSIQQNYRKFMSETFSQQQCCNIFSQ